MKDMETKTKGIREFSKQRTEQALKKVEEAIIELVELGEEITKYKVMKRSGASRKFVYGTPEVEVMMGKYAQTKEIHEVKTNVALRELEKLKEECASLQKENQTLKSALKDKERIDKSYEKLKEDYALLERQFQQVCLQKGLI